MKVVKVALIIPRNLMNCNELYLALRYFFMITRLTSHAILIHSPPEAPVATKDTRGTF